MCIGKCGISRDTRDKPITCPTPFLPVVGKDLMLLLLAVWEVPGPFRDSSPIHDVKDRQHVNGFRRATSTGSAEPKSSNVFFTLA